MLIIVEEDIATQQFLELKNYLFKLVEKNFVPKTAEDRLLISPPQKNLEVENWEEDKNNKKDNIDINTIKENLEKLL